MEYNTISYLTIPIITSTTYREADIVVEKLLAPREPSLLPGLSCVTTDVTYVIESSTMSAISASKTELSTLLIIEFLARSGYTRSFAMRE